MSLPTIRKLVDVIDRSLFTIKPPLDYHQTTYAIIKLAELVHKYDGDSDELWAIGEYGNCDLASLLVGAFGIIPSGILASVARAIVHCAQLVKCTHPIWPMVQSPIPASNRFMSNWNNWRKERNQYEC